MIGNVQLLIDYIGDSLIWIKKNQPDHYERKFLQLVEERRKLYTIKRANQEKPAIAAFGESQKGKSYLMGNLLQKGKDPFMVVNGDEKINFVRNINPIGDKKEATGVVTRFTPFNTNTTRYSDKYPVIVKLLSVSNIATILCDSYYSDVNDALQYSDDEIKSFSDEIYAKYINCDTQINTTVSADDILEIKAYLSKYVNATQNLRKSSFFENVALIIDKVSRTDWINIFKYLWHENQEVSSLFVRLTNALEIMAFKQEVYTTIDAVLHHGDNKNTILSVDCLSGLDDSTWDKMCNVYTPLVGGEFQKLASIPKCELCAICSEVIFKISDDYLRDERPYAFDATTADVVGNMPLATKNKVSDTVAKTLLAESDLLDFPGARNRLKIKAQFISGKDDDDGTSNLVQMLLRGKVAYLFNSYSESRIINILLFCHDNEQPSVTDMYIMINDWVEKYVGETSEKRRKTIQKCGGISPLFVIGTKFNIDMIQGDSEVLNSRSALDQRWTGRFNKVLYTQVFKAADVDWFKNWDAPGSTFKNCYMLRDFKYSADTGSGNNIYKGYRENIPGSSEEKLLISPEFYTLLRNSFIENADVQKFFEDPGKAWDVSATRNNDGSLYIIEKLGIVARNANQTRESQFTNDLIAVREQVQSLMSNYYVPEDDSAIVEENIRKSKSVIRELDFTCNNDNYYFGHLIQALQLSEAEVIKLVHKLIRGSELTTVVNDFKEYELIRVRCNNFEGCNNDHDKWEAICKNYGFTSADEARNYMDRRAVNHSLLFTGEYKKKMNSTVIVNSVINYWKEKIKSIDFMNTFCGDNSFDSIVMGNLIETIISCADALKLSDELELLIQDQVNVVDISRANESLIADMLASTISDFVINFGYNRLSPETLEKAKRIISQPEYKLRVFDYITRERKSTYNEDELAALFDETHHNHRAVTTSFDNSYYSWIEYMTIAYVSHLNMPEYDVVENRKLAELLENIKKLS